LKNFKLAIFRGHMSLLIDGASKWIGVDSWEAIAEILDSGATVPVIVEGLSA
jgi:hypothetical protein